MILDEIIERKRNEVAAAKNRCPVEELHARLREGAPARDFRRALAARRDVALIAELKRKSPSAGTIREEFDPVALATAYAEGGAAALSVLTDEHFFGGRLDFIAQAKGAANLPVLRKDFIIDAYQVDESRAAGADAVLLIVRVLSDNELVALLERVHRLGMAALVEVHDAEEARRAVRCGARVIGVNNRDLDSLSVDLQTTRALARHIPADRTLVSESGIGSRRDIETLAPVGVEAVLVGESLMKRDDLAGAARELTGVPRVPRRS
jgi:indole-3-glycerol phosphate synthase